MTRAEDKLARDMENALAGVPKKFRKGMWVKDKTNKVGRVESIHVTGKNEKWIVMVCLVWSKKLGKYRPIRRSRWSKDLRPV